MSTIPFCPGDPDLRAAVFPAQLATCRGAAGRDPGAGETHRDEPAADLGARSGAAVRELPSRAEPCRLSPRAASRLLLGVLVAAFVPAGPIVLGIDDDLPRPGALIPWPLRESLRPALAQPDAAGADPLGRQGLGAAVLDNSGPIRARLPGTWLVAQKVDRLGAATGAADTALVAGTRYRRAALGRPADTKAGAAGHSRHGQQVGADRLGGAGARRGLPEVPHAGPGRVDKLLKFS